MIRRAFLLLPALALVLTSMTTAQTTGSIIGTVKDAQGLVMPGVTVSLTGQAVMGEQSANTIEDGTYRFRALGPGTYNLRFELVGFQILNREGIIVAGGRTVTVNVTLDVATVAETITVTGESPVVDVKNTALSNEFSTSELQDIPSATDVWAVLGQTAGVRMLGYDVGGSHKSQQSGYESFGIRDQNRVMSEGVDSTEGTGGTGFYYSYYSIEEFTTAAAGADVEMTTPGSMIMMTVKSGGNEFSGMIHQDYEGENMVSNNVDSALEQRGYTGNPNLLFWEFHGDVGGPIVRDRAWFYGFYGHFKIDKQISGVDPSLSTDIGDFDLFGGKLNVKLTEKDNFIGYTNYQLKEKPNRGLSATTPPESILAQASWSWVHKAEWQRVWSDRVFSNVQLKHFGFGWPMVPAVDPVSNPPRIDTATSFRSGAGWNGGFPGAPPFTFTRWKPQLTASANYYVPGAAGSHDLKFGFDWMVDSSQYGSNANSGAYRYADNSSLGNPNNVDEIAIYSVRQSGPNLADNRDKHTDFFAQDTWTLNDRLTLVLGLRYGRQDMYYLDAELDPDEKDFFPTGSIPGQDLVTWNALAPRIGVTYDLSGDGKTVLKGHYGRYFINIADQLSAANPASYAYVRYKFLDPNQNGVYDGPNELGELISTRGTVGSTIEDVSGTPVNPDLKKSYADEFSFSVEREVAENTGVRFSYVRKQLRNDFDQWNKAQVLPLLQNPVPCGDAVFPCPINPLTGNAITTMVRVPDAAAGAQDQGIDTFPGDFSNDDWDTIQFAFDRRFSNSFFVQTSFDYQWRHERRRADAESDSPLSADPIYVGFYQNHDPAVSNIQDSTNWNFRLMGRYVLPLDIAVSGNMRMQSGWPWAPIARFDIPGSGTQPVFLEEIKNNRSQNVTIFDLRIEKIFQLNDRLKLTGMLDFYNLLNANPETNFVLRTGSSFRDIIGVLDPRAIKLGIRFQF